MSSRSPGAGRPVAPQETTRGGVKRRPHNLTSFAARGEQGLLTSREFLPLREEPAGPVLVLLPEHAQTRPLVEPAQTGHHVALPEFLPHRPAEPANLPAPGF